MFDDLKDDQSNIATLQTSIAKLGTSNIFTGGVQKTRSSDRSLVMSVSNSAVNVNQKLALNSGLDVVNGASTFEIMISNVVRFRCLTNFYMCGDTTSYEKIGLM